MKYTISDLAGSSRKALDGFLHPKILWLSLAGIMACASALATFSRFPVRPATIWFPKARGDGTVAELRYLRARDNPEAAVRALTEEIMLGPMREDLSAVADPGAAVSLVLVRNRSLYVDLGADVFFGKRTASGVFEPGPVSPERLLSIVAKTISWNFPGLRLTLSIDGKTLARDAQEEVTVAVKKE